MVVTLLSKYCLPSLVASLWKARLAHNPQESASGTGGEGLKISTGAFVKIWWLGSELHLTDLNPSTP